MELEDCFEAAVAVYTTQGASSVHSIGIAAAVSINTRFKERATITLSA